jgi:hypothetical protein
MTTFNGSLDITVHDAKLTLPQHLSKQDPYCVVTLGSSGLKNLMEGERLGKEKFQTKVHNNAGQHPVWNETHSLSLKNMTFESHLKVKIYDKDVVKDDYLGLTKINLDELMRYDNKGVQYFPIHKKGTLKESTSEVIGQVGLSLKFNCTEIPTTGSDLKHQTAEAMTRKDQAPMGVHGAYQQGQPMHVGGPQQSVPSTYQGPVQTIHPQYGSQTIGGTGGGIGGIGTGGTYGSHGSKLGHKDKVGDVTGTLIGIATVETIGVGHKGPHGTHGYGTQGYGTHGAQGTSGLTQGTGTGYGITGAGTGTQGYGTGIGIGTSTGYGTQGGVTTFNGSIDVTIADAKTLETQHWSKQDPYCVVALGSSGLKTMMEGESLGKEKFQTKVHNGAGQHPVWNETHSLSLKNMKFDSHLEVRLYDKDVLKDDYIGIARMTLGELLPCDKRGVQYYPLYKIGALRQITSEQIGQIGVGVVFNCTEIPQGQADMRSQVTDAMVRKDQQLSGVSGPYQTAQPLYTQPMNQPMNQPMSGHTTGTSYPQQTQSTMNRPLDTKPVHTQGTQGGMQGMQGMQGMGTIPQQQGQYYGH